MHEGRKQVARHILTVSPAQVCTLPLTHLHVQLYMRLPILSDLEIIKKKNFKVQEGAR